MYIHHTSVARYEELQDVFIPERCKDIMNIYNIIPDPIAKVDGTTSNLKKLVGEKDTETKSHGALKQVMRCSRCPNGLGGTTPTTQAPVGVKTTLASRRFSGAWQGGAMILETCQPIGGMGWEHGKSSRM